MTDFSLRSAPDPIPNDRSNRFFFESKTVVALSLVLLGFLILIPRWKSYHEPLMCDEATFAVMGHEWLNGRAFYTDLVDQKPPLLYVTYALGEKIFGYGDPQCLGLGLLAALLTLAAVYKTGTWWRGRAVDGLLAAAFWALVSADGMLEANKPMAEAFMSLFLAWGFWFSLPGRNREMRWVPWIFAGTAFALASFYKNTACWVSLSISLLYVFSFLKDRRPSKSVGAFACFMGPTIFAWGVYVLYAKATGFWPDLKAVLWTFNRFYGGSFPSALATGPFHWHPNALFLLPAIGLTLTAIVWGWNRADRAGWVMAAFGVGIYGAVCSYHYQRGYYHQLWLPFVSVGIGWFWALASEKTECQVKRLSAIVLAAVFLLLLAREFPWWSKTAEEWSFAKYETSFIVDKPIAEDLKRILLPGEPFYVFSYHSGLYILTRQSPPSGVLVEVFLRTGPLQEEYARKAEAQLEKNRNEIIVCWNHFEKQEWETNPFILWTREHYRPLVEAPHPGSMIFLVRKGGRLDHTYPCAPNGYGPGPGWGKLTDSKP